MRQAGEVADSDRQRLLSLVIEQLVVGVTNRREVVLSGERASCCAEMARETLYLY